MMAFRLARGILVLAVGIPVLAVWVLLHYFYRPEVDHGWLA